MNWLRRMMEGRNGTDHLSFALLLVGFVLSVIANLFGWFLINILSWIAIIFCLYRTLSKNLDRRFQENQKFLTFWNAFKGWFKDRKSRAEASKYYKYYKCPNCSQNLRVPKGKGKIRISCPGCGNKFEKKT